MDFKDLFDRYEKGNVTEEERKIVEEEIEKNKIINDYLLKDFSDDFNMLKEEPYFNKEEESKLKKKMKKSSSGIIFKSIVLMILLVISFNLIIEPIWNSFYFDPKGEAIEEEDGASYYKSELFLNTYVFTELHLPNYKTNFTSSTRTGIGKYNINIINENIFRNEYENINLTLDKNKLDKDTFWLFDFPAINTFEYPYKDINQDEFEKVSIATAHLTLKRDLTLDEVLKLYKEYDVNFSYLAVRISDGKESSSIIGFNPGIYHEVMNENIHGIEVDKEVFPNLLMGGIEKGDLSEKINEDHFKSMLKYMSLKDDYLNTFFNSNYFNGITYKGILDYVEKNGINIYGITIEGATEELLKIFEDEAVEGFLIEESRFSVYDR